MKEKKCIKIDEYDTIGTIRDRICGLMSDVF